MLRMKDLTLLPGLGITVLSCSDAQLERAISWTFTTDLLDPSRYVSPGQVVLTGLVWYSGDPADTETFVAAVERAGAVGLLAGEGLHGCVPDDVVAACTRHGLPLLAVPAEVSFAEIGAQISERTHHSRATKVTHSLIRQRQLLSALADEHLLEEVVQQFRLDHGLDCWVVTAGSRRVVDHTAAVTERDLDEILLTALTAARLPASAQTLACSVFGVGPDLGHRLGEWFVVVGGRLAELSPAVLESVEELVAVAALERARREGAVLAWHDISDRLVQALETEGFRAETSALLRQIGLDPDRPLLVVAAEFPDDPDLRPTARRLLSDMITGPAPGVVGLTADAGAVALLQPDLGTADPAATSELVADRLRAALSRLAPQLGRRRMAVGVSRPVPLPELAGAIAAARYARVLGSHEDHAVVVVTSDQVSSAVTLLRSAVPERLQRTFAAQVLGAVADYDERNNSGLIPTLTAFLECDGSWNRTAERLGLHQNTVRYRVARVEELTGRDLSSLEDRLDIFLALRLR